MGDREPGLCLEPRRRSKGDRYQLAGNGRTGRERRWRRRPDLVRSYRHPSDDLAAGGIEGRLRARWPGTVGSSHGSGAAAYGDGKRKHLPATGAVLQADQRLRRAHWTGYAPYVELSADLE